MSNTELESENQVTSSTGNAEESSECDAGNNPKNKRKSDSTIKGKSVDTSADSDVNEVSTNEASSENADTSEVGNENKKSKLVDMSVESKTKDVQDQLQEILGDSSESPSRGIEDSPSKITSNVTTETLLSVLEDESENPPTTEENSLSSTQPENKLQSANKVNVSASKSTSQLVTKSGTSSKVSATTEKKSETSKASKRYSYKLKSKSGKVLKFTSCTPIVLKKPVITLTKMVDEEIKSENTSKPLNEADEVDSDSSTKENMKENDASTDTVIRTGRRGRPPGVSQKKAAAAAAAAAASSEEVNSSDAGDSKSTPSYGMQTRKRQMRFLPDGRVVTPGKRSRLDEGKKDAGESSLTETDEDSDIDHDSHSDRKGNKPNSAKKPPPAAEKQSTEKKGKFKKVFDFESYFREKSGTTPAPEIQTQTTPTPEIRTQTEKTPSASVKEPETPTNKTPANTTTPVPKKITSVDPAQLLSSLIGVPITPSQLNIVKFKPKVIQDRANAATNTPKKVTFEEEKAKRTTSSNPTELLKNTPFKLVSKPTFQKILPKPSPSFDKIPVMKKVLEHRLSTSTPVSSYPAIAPKGTPESTASDVQKFENFTDSKVVKTKGGPKKVLKRKLSENIESPQTIYELMLNVFDQMPSWNLHIIPDTHSFCIAQVSRGRMGIPILKKSIELNAEFFAKVYVHQLHCKRYDGVYDTESKIVNLIKEIDALAA